MVTSPIGIAKQRFEDSVYKVLEKYVPYSSGAGHSGYEDTEAPYHREVPPEWIYNIRRSHALINNAIEEKVNQAFRRGFDEWEKAYVAKCPKCDAEYGSDEEFRESLSEHYGDELGLDTEANIDFEKDRLCPACDEIVSFTTPDEDMKEVAEDYFRLANGRNSQNPILQPSDDAALGQSFLGVAREVSRDIQSFDDGWMIFERSYKLDANGSIVDFDLEGVKRGPPELMKYSADEETTDYGGEFWVCPKCRATKEQYNAQKKAGDCENCGNDTYEVYAVLTENPGSDKVQQYFIAGEVVHDSEFAPSKYHGYSPIVTLFDEARTLQQMDKWYQTAYEKRRAPRGALVIRSGNSKSAREWNKKQFTKLQSDPNHIPTMMDDSENGSGDPLSFINLLESPAEMQNMEMREWFKDRISAKYGVTEILMSGSPENSGLSQSMEVQVSNRAADRLRAIFNDTFLPAFLAQIGADGWTRQVAEVEERDEQMEQEMMGTALQNAQLASKLGLNVTWTEEDRVEVKPGEVEMEEQGGEEGMGGLGGMMGGMGEQQPADDPEGQGGEPADPPRPDDGDPLERSSAESGRIGNNAPQMIQELSKEGSVEVYDEEDGMWKQASLSGVRGDRYVLELSNGGEIEVTDDGEVIHPA